MVAGLFWGGISARADALTLTYESAPSLAGPWQPVDPAQVQINPNGSASVNVDRNAFFRMRVVENGREASIPVVALAQVPPDAIKAARNHLARFVASPESVAEEWADADLAPFATPLGDPANPAKSTHFEFKLLAKPNPLRTGGFRRFGSDQNTSLTRGYMVCSADRSDLPILEFSTEGESVVESLLRKCGGTAPARILRFGPSFWVAENEKGELLANHGTEPFKVPAGFAAEMSTSAAGVIDTETGVTERPPATKTKPAYYRDYREFKADFETNAVYTLMRKRRTEQAKEFWDAEQGILPQILRVAVGQTETFLPRTSIDNLLTDIELGERAVADVATLRTGGFRAIGRTPGRMTVKVRVGESVTRYVLEVTSPAVAGIQAASVSAPHWKTVTEAYAGAWADQMRWYQLRSSDWCDLVGCGPTALGMLLGWWETKKNVPSAFYTQFNSFSSLNSVDAPQYLDTAAKRSIVRQAYNALHEYCDVICNPFGDDGATMPGDLIEGWENYLQPVASSTGLATLLFGGKPLVGYSYSWAYDWWGDDWEVSGSKVANGIKSGRPGVVGLGVLWHYVVAYGYLRQDYVVTVNGNDQYLGLRARYFKCNEGWNKSSPAWYSAYDVFLGLTANVWQKNIPKQP